MGALSTFAAAGMQNLTFRGESFASPATVYLGWFTSPPSADGTATQVTGGGHTREAITFLAASGGTIVQDAAVTWATFHSGADQMIAGWGIWDAATAGNLIAYGRTPSKRISLGAAFTVAAGGITIASNDRAMSDYLADAWLDHLLNGAAYSPASNVYLGHYTATPTASTAGTEVTGTGYARQEATWEASGDGSSVLEATVSWIPLNTDTDATLTGWALSDDPTAGDVLWFYGWPTTIDYTAGDVLEMLIGSVTLRAL